MNGISLIKKELSSPSTSKKLSVSRNKDKQITVVVGVVQKDGKILMVKRNEPEQIDVHQKWEIPGGKIDFGENIEEALEREIKEESGVNAKVVKLLPMPYVQYWNYSWGRQQTLLFGFECRFISEGRVHPDHHVSDIMWVKIDEVKNLERLPGVDFFISQLRH